jgi:uncharacterized membrane protein
MQNPNAFSTNNPITTPNPDTTISARLGLARMLAASFALIGSLIALYLLLVDVGVSPLVCPTTGCEVVQTSSFAKILGLPTALYGLGVFLALLGLSVYGLFANTMRLVVVAVTIQPVLVAISGGAVGFYLYLSYLEAFVIRAWCLWCVGSSLMMLGVLLSSLWGFRR